MRKLIFTLFLLLAVLGFQFCSPSKKSAATAPVAVLTYDKDVKPIIQSTCAPCHIEGKGRKKPLDNYANASSSADDIIARIQKNPGEPGFMPVMHDKLPDSTIQAFVNWKGGGLQEK